MVVKNAAAYLGTPVYVVLEYTKTTDTATKAVAEPLSTMTLELPSYDTAAASAASATLAADTPKNEEV